MMYSGPGSGSLTAAAAAWEGLAADLSSIASSYQSVLSGLSGAWQGPSAGSMTGAAEEFLSWLTGTAAQVEQAGSQAQAAASAFESAFAATVPPPLIAANRTQLATLVATNILGQNTPAIFATEAQYAEMWAQDVAMMIGYAVSSAEATVMQVFSLAPQVASGALGVLQSLVAPLGGGSNILASLPQLVPTALSSLVSPTALSASDPLSGGLSNALGLLGLGSGSGVSGLLGSTVAPVGAEVGLGTVYMGSMTAIPARTFMGMNGSMAGMSPALLNTVGQFVDGKFQVIAGSLTNQLRSWGAAVTAQLAHATSLNGLSVPQAWSAAAEATLTRAAPVLPDTTVSAPTLAPQAGMPGGPFGQALMGALSGRGLSSLAAKAPKVVPRSPAGG